MKAGSGIFARTTETRKIWHAAKDPLEISGCGSRMAVVSKMYFSIKKP
jgi:hypothetical protein